MPWKTLQSISGLDEIVLASSEKPQLIFKHSTRCSISFGAKSRLDDKLDALSKKYDVHYLDLLSHRDISAQIADRLGVWHESPQVIVLSHGKVLSHQNHGSISPGKLLELV